MMLEISVEAKKWFCQLMVCCPVNIAHHKLQRLRHLVLNTENRNDLCEFVSTRIFQKINTGIDFYFRSEIILQRGFDIKTQPGIAISETIEIFVVFEKRTALEPETQCFTTAVIKWDIGLECGLLCPNSSRKKKKQQKSKSAGKGEYISIIICDKSLDDNRMSILSYK